MTYWKLLSLLLINVSFFLWAQKVFESSTEKERLNFCFIQGHWVASCKALNLPLGSVFLLDILSLMNCHSSHLRLHRGSRTLPGHTHVSPTANGIVPVVQHPSHSERHSCHRSSSAGIFCLCPSFPNLWPHTLVQLWQAAAASWPRPSPPPGLLHRPETSVCCKANEQENWGNFRVKCWNRTSGPPQQSCITEIYLFSHMRNIILSFAEACCAVIPWTWTLFNSVLCFFTVWYIGRDDTCKYHLFQISKWLPSCSLWTGEDVTSPTWYPSNVTCHFLHIYIFICSVTI